MASTRNFEELEIEKQWNGGFHVMMAGQAPFRIEDCIEVDTFNQCITRINACLIPLAESGPARPGWQANRISNGLCGAALLGSGLGPAAGVAIAAFALVDTYRIHVVRKDLEDRAKHVFRDHLVPDMYQRGWMVFLPEDQTDIISCTRLGLRRMQDGEADRSETDQEAEDDADEGQEHQTVPGKRRGGHRQRERRRRWRNIVQAPTPENSA